MIEVTVPMGFEARRADKALALLLPETPAWALREAFSRRDVKRDGVRIGPGDSVRAGERLRIYLPALPAPQIAWEDEEYLLLDKRQGMPSTAEESGSAEAAVSRFLGAPVYACHRLDAQTGGLLLLARTPAARDAALAWFSAHQVRKVYRCLVRGCPVPAEAELCAFLLKDAENARVTVLDAPCPGALSIRTGYRVVEPGEVSRLEVTLGTGRTHQIRAHLAHIGHPVLGDDKYGDRAFNRAHHARRQQLWSVELRLPDGRGARIQEPF